AATPRCRCRSRSIPVKLFSICSSIESSEARVKRDPSAGSDGGISRQHVWIRKILPWSALRSLGRTKVALRGQHLSSWAISWHHSCKFVGPWRKSRVPERSVFEGRHRTQTRRCFSPGITKNATVVSGGFPERHACQLRQMAGKVGASASRIDRVEIIMPAGGGDSGNQHVEGCFVRETPDGEEILTGRKRLC